MPRARMVAIMWWRLLGTPGDADPRSFGGQTEKAPKGRAKYRRGNRGTKRMPDGWAKPPTVCHRQRRGIAPGRPCAIRDNAKPTLDKLAELIRLQKPGSVAIEGHTDSRAMTPIIRNSPRRAPRASMLIRPAPVAPSHDTRCPGDAATHSLRARVGKETGSAVLRYTRKGVWTTSPDIHALSW